MTNQIYDAGRRALLNAQINWPSIDLTVTAWGGTPDFDTTDETLADIQARSHVIMGSSLPVVGTTVALDGTAQTDQVLIPGIPIGPPVTWLTLSKKVAPLANSQLILFLDDVYEFPFIPNGLDMLISPDWLENRGWFKP